MRKLMALAAIGTVAAFGSIGAAQDNASPMIRRSYDLGAFDKISMVGPHRVVVSVGGAYSVSAEGPRETLDHTEVVVVDGGLTIRPSDDEWWQRRWRERRDNEPYEAATYRITLPRLAAATLAGSGDMSVDRVEGDEFAASVAGSGGLDVADLRVEEARFSVAGSGELSARGVARRSRISIAGSGNLRGRGVRSETANVSVAGSGDVSLTVEEDARVSIVGSGDVDIAGPARCAVSRLGSGRVRCNGTQAVS